MGRSYTPKFRIEVDAVRLSDHDRFSWQQGWAGPRNENKIKAWARDFEASTFAGGSNAHLGVTLITGAKIIEQRTHMTVCEWKPAKFEVA